MWFIVILNFHNRKHNFGMALETREIISFIEFATKAPVTETSLRRRQIENAS